MRGVIIFLFLFFITAYADDEGGQKTKAAEQNQQTTDSLTQTNSINKLNMNDFKKFYIGYNNSEGCKNLFTMEIKALDSLDNEIKFQYTMNSKNNRKDEQGKIFLDKSTIKFAMLDEGKIFQTEEGKIVFESIKQDSLNYWEIKEK